MQIIQYKETDARLANMPKLSLLLGRLWSVEGVDSSRVMTLEKESKDFTVDDMRLKGSTLRVGFTVSKVRWQFSLFHGHSRISPSFSFFTLHNWCHCNSFHYFRSGSGEV
ncbi:hypothetical protein PHAVU_005G092218 [Phaseolus vulgaris]